MRKISFSNFSTSYGIIFIVSFVVSQVFTGGNVFQETVVVKVIEAISLYLLLAANVSLYLLGNWKNHGKVPISAYLLLSLAATASMLLVYFSNEKYSTSLQMQCFLVVVISTTVHFIYLFIYFCFKK